MHVPCEDPVEQLGRPGTRHPTLRSRSPIATLRIMAWLVVPPPLRLIVNNSRSTLTHNAEMLLHSGSPQGMYSLCQIDQ